MQAHPAKMAQAPWVPAGNTYRSIATACCAALAALTAACTPALNWRDVTLERLRVNLPCKPDRAQRPVRLQNTALDLSMAGCEASGALFAVSHTRVPPNAAGNAVLSAWQSATLENMRVKNAAQVLAAYQRALASQPAATIGQVQALHVNGSKPDGHAVQARLVWFVAGKDIYHLAVYGNPLHSEMTEPLFLQARLQ